MKMEQCVPKRRHVKFRRRGITQQKAYNKVKPPSQLTDLNKLKDNNKYVFGQEQQYIIIERVDNAFRSLDHHQAIFT